MLHAQQFQVRRFAARRGRVTFQSPRQGRRARDGTVGLTLGRHAFDGRALERCLEAAGIPTRILRPLPDDTDAPDLDLWLGPPLPDTWAFVALYADPGRATERLRGIRRNARRFHGDVERINPRITVAWAKPTPARRAAVRGCLAGANP